MADELAQGTGERPEHQYPLLAELRFRSEKELNGGHVPQVFSTLLAYCDVPEPGGTCFVLPSIAHVPLALAVMVALTRLQTDLPELLANYAARDFKLGERIAVLPTGHVYEYAGFFPHQYGDFFRLKLLGEESYRSLPAINILRLQPTERLRPKGKERTKLGSLQSVPLDSILNLRTGGNINMMRNQVILVSQIGRTGEQTAEYSVSAVGGTGASAPARLTDLLPWGRVRPDGQTRVDGSAKGEPVIAVASSLDSAAAAIRRRENRERPPIVVVDGAGMVRNLDALDSLTDSSRLAVLATRAEREQIEECAARGLDIWELGPGDVLEGTDTTSSHFFGPSQAAAQRAQSFGLQLETVDCEALTNAVEALATAERELRANEPLDDVKDVITGVYAIVTGCAELFDGESEQASRLGHRLRLVVEEVSRRRMYWPAAVSQALDEACNKIAQFLSEPNESGLAKIEAIRAVVGSAASAPAVVLTRGPAAANSLRELLGSRYDNVDVLTCRDPRPRDSYSEMIFASWPGRRRAERILEEYATPHAVLVLYSFEQRWSEGTRKRVGFRYPAWQPDAARRRRLTGLGGWQPATPQEPVPTVPTDPSDDWLSRPLPVQTVAGSVPLADRREARVVRFLDGSYAFLTAGHKVPVVTDLVLGRHDADARVPLRTTGRLESGDYVLFRDSGDKDAVAIVAAIRVGEERYDETRALAGSWRSALAKVGETVEGVHAQLKAAGLRRHIATVRNWLRDESLIGPGEKSDLETIAIVAGDSGLTENLEAVWEAIRRIRAAHISAGQHLSALLLKELPDKLTYVSSASTEIDLAFGSGRIVQIEEIADEPIEVAYFEANCLRHADTQ